MYKKIFLVLIKIFKLKTTNEILYKPEGITKWGYSDEADQVYQIYVGSNTKNLGFGFYVHDDVEGKAYKKAIIETISNLKWFYKTKYRKWINALN